MFSRLRRTLSHSLADMAKDGKEEYVDQLLEAGADPNSASFLLSTPLMVILPFLAGNFSLRELTKCPFSPLFYIFLGGVLQPFRLRRQMATSLP